MFNKWGITRTPQNPSQLQRENIEHLKGIHQFEKEKQNFEKSVFDSRTD